MKTIAVEILEEGKVLQRKKIELNRKIVSAPFFCENVTSTEDIGILCEMGGYSTPELNTLGFLGATMYNIFDYAKITASWKSSINQSTLWGGRVSAEFKQMEETKLKFIDPNTELYGIKFKQLLYRYIKLKPPKFLLDHLKEMVLKGTNGDDLHIKFWERLFPSDDKERADAGSLINWTFRQEKKCGIDVFIPPIPSLNARNCGALIDKSISMNKMASDIVTDDVATYFSLSADVFENRSAVHNILNCIAESKNKIGVIKFTDPHNFVNISFSEHAQNNLSLFLKTLKFQNQNKESPMMMGTLGGGAFGYCLLGAGFDFFTDTVNNYAQYPMPARGSRARYRKCLNDRRLVLEKFDGLKSKFLEEDQDPLPYLPVQRGKYTKQQFEKGSIDPSEWSRNCRLHGIGMWDEFTKQVYEAIHTKTDILFFDKIQRSAYAMLAPIINEVQSF